MAKMIDRYRVTFPGQDGAWFGTCKQWADKMPKEATVTKERVQVVNPQMQPCGECGGQHVAVSHPDTDLTPIR